MSEKQVVITEKQIEDAKKEYLKNGGKIDKLDPQENYGMIDTREYWLKKDGPLFGEIGL